MYWERGYSLKLNRSECNRSEKNGAYSEMRNESEKVTGEKLNRIKIVHYEKQEKVTRKRNLKNR